jgi:hypothetical protein
MSHTAHQNTEQIDGKQVVNKHRRSGDRFPSPFRLPSSQIKISWLIANGFAPIWQARSNQQTVKIRNVG